jgi:hypothetical protein
MDNQTKINKLSVAGVLLLWLLWLLSQIAQSLLTDIPNNFYDQLGILLGYKTLLRIGTLLLTATLSLLILYYSKHSKAKEPINDIPIKPDHNIIDKNPNPAIDKSLHTNDPRLVEKEIQEGRIRLLKNLSGGEKRILKGYFEKDSKAQMFHLADGGAAGMVAKGILFCPTQYGYGVETAYNITEWAWEYLKEHPKLLE